MKQNLLVAVANRENGGNADMLVHEKKEFTRYEYIEICRSDSRFLAYSVVKSITRARYPG